MEDIKDVVFKDEVKEIIFGIRGEISDLSEKMDKYIERTDEQIEAKQKFIKVLERVAKNLPERQPGIFDPNSFAQESEEPKESPSLIEETAGISEEDVT
jgi:hypothetical protein